ncbi:MULTISPECIES: hypothetical protein [Streptomyces]|uniref:hypothetical protein n=1 Tax=Streptomyces TaxID=1883 RepID=UPI00131EE1A8|nr:MULTISPECIES: hypothetical protein [Streptomyces]MDX3204809.1 hypothetical protein [Streptomyces scabiei]
MHYRSWTRPRFWAAECRRAGAAVEPHRVVRGDNVTATQRRSSGQKIAAVRARKHTAALLLVGSLLALAGCSGSDSDTSSKSSSTPTAVSPSPSSTVDANEAAVLASYNSSWAEQTKAYSKASSAGTDLKKNTTLRALFDIEHDLEVMRKAGQVTTGKPVINPKVVKVTDGKIPTATVTDCIDTTHWILTDKASKKPVPLPTTRLIKYVSTATLEKWGKTWMVTKLTAQEQAC